MNAINFIKQHGVDKAREVVDGAPIGCTHYRVLSCGTRYTKHISISECYIWNGIMWRACSTPDLVFTSGVIYPISELKKALKSQENNEIRLFRRYDINNIKNMLETVPDGATHVTDDMRMFVNEHFDHLETIKNQIPFLARISDLKRLVESVGLINKLDGIAVAKEKLAYGNSISAMRLSYETTITDRDGTKQNVITGVYLEDLEQAIADYEAIYSGAEQCW